MKKIIWMFLIITLSIAFMCSCAGENISKDKTIFAKEGSQPGIAIIGDYTIRIINTPKYVISGSNQYGNYYASKLMLEIEIENNSDETIGFYDVEDLGMEIRAYEKDVYCGIMQPQNGSHLIDPGEKEQYVLYGSEVMYGASPDTDGYYGGKEFEVRIMFDMKVITSKHFSI